MERKELYLNVRKAYRLAYEVQDSIVAIVDYIRTKIKTVDYAGKQVFSDPISKHRGVDEGYVTDYIGTDMWSWDYLPTFMYMYYFSGDPTDTRDCGFSIVQIMDNGFISMPDMDTAPSPEGFKEPDDSESYLLFAFSIWEKTSSRIWYNRDEKGSNHVKDERDEIIRISEEIRIKDNKPYIVGTSKSIFIVAKIGLEAIGSKEEADRVLQEFAKLVLDKTGYQLLIEEPAE